MRDLVSKNKMVREEERYLMLAFGLCSSPKPCFPNLYYIEGGGFTKGTIVKKLPVKNHFRCLVVMRLRIKMKDFLNSKGLPQPTEYTTWATS